MATLYVAHTGSNTSPYDTWAKAATTLQTALTAATTADLILVSHTHAESDAASVGLDFGGKALSVICVDDADDTPVSNYQAAGNGEIKSTGGSITIKNGIGFLHGLRLATDYGYGSWYCGNGSSGNGTEAFYFSKAYLKCGGSQYTMQLGYGENLHAVYEDCDFDADASTMQTRVGYGANIQIFGGRVLNAAYGGTGIFGVATYAGWLEVDGTDLTALATTDNLAVDHSSNGRGDISLRRLKLPGSWVGEYIATRYKGTRVSAMGCAAAHDGTNYAHQIQYYLGMGAGEVVDETTTVRSATFDGTHGYSFRADTDADCDSAHHLAVPLGSVRLDPTAAASDVVDVYFTSDTALDDSDVWMRICISGGTTSWNPGRTLTSARTRPGETPTGYTSGQGSWTSGKTYTYKASLDLSAEDVEEGEVLVDLIVAKASLTLYVCPQVEVS
ncbi:MAG: hypothetical protein P1P84_02595 [Deferrisomatales bacterium]|nr:hypothetical protein [Deferrisomatales bacterium]